MKNALFVIVATLNAWTAHAAIFGADNRVPALLDAPANTMSSLARSTAVAVLSANFSENANGSIKLDTGSMRDLVCLNEKFSSDPSLSYACSGFLVAPDLIVTAGHCMVNVGESRHEKDTYCPTFSWLFDYAQDLKGQTLVDNIPANNLYRCQEVIYAISEEVFPYRDYALVRLNRPVVGRTPLKLSSSPVGASDAGISMIGYPLGTPAKISSGAKVLLNDPGRESFVTNLDAFEGNSGSVVFNASQEVIGILIAGTPLNSLVDSGDKSCQVYNRCDENGENCTVPDKNTTFRGFQRIGSEVQRIQPLLELIHQAQTEK